MAVLDVAVILQATHVTDHLHSGHTPSRNGKRMRFAESSQFDTKEGMVQLAASNRRQHRRVYAAIGEAEESERVSLRERYARDDEKHAMIARKMTDKTAAAWEHTPEARRVPAARVRELSETLRDPQLRPRALLYRHEHVPGLGTPLTVPVAAFKFAHDDSSVERPPARMREHTGEVPRAVGYGETEMTRLREEGAVG